MGLRAHNHTARPRAGTKENKETTENTEHAEKQIYYARTTISLLLEYI